MLIYSQSILVDDLEEQRRNLFQMLANSETLSSTRRNQSSERLRNLRLAPTFRLTVLIHWMYLYSSVFTCFFIRNLMEHFCLSAFVPADRTSCSNVLTGRVSHKERLRILMRVSSCRSAKTADSAPMQAMTCSSTRLLLQCLPSSEETSCAAWASTSSAMRWPCCPDRTIAWSGCRLRIVTEHIAAAAAAEVAAESLQEVVKHVCAFLFHLQRWAGCDAMQHLWQDLWDQYDSYINISSYDLILHGCCMHLTHWATCILTG